MNLQENQTQSLPQTTDQSEGVETTLQSFENGGPEASTTTETQSTPESGAQGAAPTKTEAKGLLDDADVARLTEAFKAAGAGQSLASTAAPQPEKQYTQAEINKLLNVFEPTDELLAKLSDPATMKEGLAELVGGIRKEYNTLLAVQLETTRKQFETEYSPVKEAAQRAAAEAADKEFYGAYKDLDNDKAREVAGVVVGMLQQKNAFNGKTKSQAAELIAGETRAMLKRLGVSASPSGSGTQQTQSGQSRKPAALSSGAGGGAHNSGGSATPAGVSGDLQTLFG